MISTGQSTLTPIAQEDWVGAPEIEVNITEINPTTNISLVVANILKYSNGQLEVSQKNGDDWNPKSLIPPFLVPINNWDALLTEFEAQLPGEGNASLEHSWVGEYIYNFSWYQDDPESEGQIRFNLQCVWEEADGILQAMFLDIGDSQLDYDRLILRSSIENAVSLTLLWCHPGLTKSRRWINL